MLLLLKALPGGCGYGTLDELFEVISWAQLTIHDKPVGLMNVDGYYNSLLSFIENAVEEGFISPNARHIIVSAPTAKQQQSFWRNLRNMFLRSLATLKLEEYVPYWCS
ncbi:hypothetical protein P3S68_017290 [Capsicum galapagoense]